MLADNKINQFYEVAILVPKKSAGPGLPTFSQLFISRTRVDIVISCTYWIPTVTQSEIKGGNRLPVNK